MYQEKQIGVVPPNISKWNLREWEVYKEKDAPSKFERLKKTFSPTKGREQVDEKWARTFLKFAWG